MCMWRGHWFRDNLRLKSLCNHQCGWFGKLLQNQRSLYREAWILQHYNVSVFICFYPFLAILKCQQGGIKAENAFPLTQNRLPAKGKSKIRSCSALMLTVKFPGRYSWLFPVWLLKGVAWKCQYEASKGACSSFGGAILCLCFISLCFI